MKDDINTPQDIHQLVHTFYGRIQQDPLLGPVFDEVGKVNWEKHLPIMEHFWRSLLLKDEKYRRNALQPHLQIFKKLPFHPKYMMQWLLLFDITVNNLFSGKNADKAKHWAKGIGHNLTRQITRQ